MLKIGRRPALAGLLLVALAALLLLVGPTGGSLTPAPAAATSIGGADCGFFGESAANDVNTGAPDLDANYLYAPLDDLPAGSQIAITGAFPRARYFSFTLYGNDTNALTSIYDQQIQPDPGSANPFLSRPAAGQPTNYTVHIVFSAQPAHPAVNTLYAGAPSALGTVGYVVLRYYLPVGSPSGGVPYPQVTVQDAAGSPLSVSEGACADTFSIQGAYYDHYAMENAAANAATPADGTSSTIAFTRSFDNGFGNQQNTYVQSLVSHHWGQLVVLHFKAPTTPDTSAGQPVYGRWNLRYWSLCDYDATGTAVYGCLPDHAVPRDRHGYVTIVVSEAGQRPADATTADGVAWLPWSPQNEIQLVERNMLPAASFHHAGQDIETPAENADAAKIMGAYYPTAGYCSEATFASGGWQACLPALARALARSQPAHGKAKAEPVRRRRGQ